MVQLRADYSGKELEHTPTVVKTSCSLLTREMSVGSFTVMLSSPRQLCAPQSLLNIGTNLLPAVGAAIAGRAKDRGADSCRRSTDCFSRLVREDFRNATSKELLGLKSCCLGELNAESALDGAKSSSDFVG